MNKLIIVYWRDIPAQVIGRKGRKTVFKAMLEPKFQHTIDRAAMRAGKGGSEAYIEEWRREAVVIEGAGDLAEIARDEARQLESAFSDEQLTQLIRNHGVTEN